jgi:hypothetical protein
MSIVVIFIVTVTALFLTNKKVHAMKSMKHLLFLLVSTFIFFHANAQDQIRVRFGASKSFNSGKNAGFNMTGGHKAPLPSGFGLEYYRPLPSKKMGLLFGVFGELEGYSGGLNPDKFPPGIFTMKSASTYGSIRLYGGIEKILTGTTRPNANTISVIGGVAVGINTMGLYGNISYPSLNKPIQTKDGDKYQWLQSSSFNGYSSVILMRPRTANLFTPELFGGLRWNIKNHQGKTVFVTEGVVNYSLLPKARIEFPYTLNGKPMVDKINDHGFNVQVNALIPVKTFWKKTKK